MPGRNTVDAIWAGVQASVLGGIVEIEAPIHISNLKVIDPTTGKADRVGRKKLEDGSIVRYAKKSGAVLDKQA